jgi:dTDP-4-dehydrorhamnose 3,5-epimerase
MVQVNHSRSRKGVLRGLHWQQPNPVGKYVTCIHGRILDVVVDIRKSSPGFKTWRGYEIDAESGQSLWVPEGYAHGFLVISPMADVLYAQSAAFDPEGDRVLRWNDPEVGISWPAMLKEYVISEKDATAPLLSELPGEALFD